MAETIYVLCALLSAACAFLLLRQYQSSPGRLLFWSGIGFIGLALNNALLVVDLVVLPASIDLSVLRTLLALAAMAGMLFGFIWESR